MKPLKYLKIIVSILVYLIVSLPIVFAEELNLQYDAVGNLVTGDSFYREYDGFNHLIRIKQENLSSGNISEEFIWHPTEERVLIKKIYWNNQSLRTTIKYLNKNTIKIRNESGIFYENYIYQDDALVAQIDANGNKQAVHNDHLGSVLLITDSTGAVIENSFFSPFGEQIVPVTNSRFSFTGKEFDTISNEYDFISRRSRPDWANRLTTPDRIFYDFTKYEKERQIAYYDPQLINPYVYARSNPYKFVDKEGDFLQYAIPIFIGGFIIGAVSEGIRQYNVGEFSLRGIVREGTIGGFVAASAAIVISATTVASPILGGLATVGYETYEQADLAKTGSTFNINIDKNSKQFGKDKMDIQIPEEDLKKIKKPIGTIELPPINIQITKQEDKLRSSISGGGGGGGGSYCRGTCTYGPGVPSWESKYGNNKKSSKRN